jgi:hypothetical protein
LGGKVVAAVPHGLVAVVQSVCTRMLRLAIDDHEAKIAERIYLDAVLKK